MKGLCLATFYCSFLLLGFSQNAKIFFDFNQSDLISAEKVKLFELSQQLTPKTDYEIYLTGHTDTTGQASKNKVLSSKRVQTVARYLTERGFKVFYRNADYLGESAPSQSNTDSTNRRVELTWINIKNNHQPVRQPKSLAAWIPENQTTLVDPYKSTTIKGKKGTLIQIPPNAFIYGDQEPVTSSIKIVLQEYYEAKEIIAAGLTTMSGNELLESGGMIHVAAEANNRTVFLKDKQSIQVTFPNKQAEMQLFYGSPNDSTSIDWQLNSTSPLSTQSVSGFFDLNTEPNVNVNISENGMKLIDVLLIDAAAAEEKRAKKMENAKRRMSKQEAGRRLVANSFRSADLGWINCDRFYRDKRAVFSEILVSTPNDTSESTIGFVVFNDIRSIIPMQRMENGQFLIRMRMPINKSAAILFVDMHSEQLKMAHKPIKTSSKIATTVALKPASLQGLEKTLALSKYK